ncbi:unnamed protein product [Owenia fusiformis]|uniref:G-protein coupled receptors family 1 profile domain-containing protein n=1 Tax=Owenia fusiformis TaxID=6347 RepID=A0A8S4PFM0_OWEFU|nr:unnamed protein product [Owenia fusiformis]
MASNNTTITNDTSYCTVGEELAKDHALPYVIYGILVVIGIPALLGNILCIAAILKLPALKNTHFFYINLSIADIIVVISRFFDNLFFWNVSSSAELGNFGRILFFVSYTNSGLTLMSIAAIICYTVKYPLQAHFTNMEGNENRWRTFGVIGITWLISLTTITTALCHKIDESFTLCYPGMLLSFYMFCILLFVIILALYCTFYHRIQDNLMARPKGKGTLRTTLIMASTLLACSLPYMVFRILRASLFDCITEVQYVYRYLFVNLPVLNAMSDPLIYGYRTIEIRKSFYRMFHMKKGELKPDYNCGNRTVITNINDHSKYSADSISSETKHASKLEHEMTAFLNNKNHNDKSDV